MKYFFPAAAGVAILLAFVAVVHADSSINWGVTCDTYNTFANVSNRDVVAQPFVPSEDSQSVAFTGRIVQIGTPVDSVQLSVEADSSGHPSGTPLGSISDSTHFAGAAGTAPCDGSSYSYAPITGLFLTSGTTYWVVFGRTGVLNDTNAYRLGENTSFGGLLQLSSGSWSALGSSGAYGSLALTAGSGGGGTSTSTGAYATSTIEQAQTNLMNGFFVYFISFFGMVWLLRKR